MFIYMRHLPAMPDRHICIACIRACIWARVEGRPYCELE
jgi:hypothetical protein